MVGRNNNARNPFIMYEAEVGSEEDVEQSEEDDEDLYGKHAWLR